MGNLKVMSFNLRINTEKDGVNRFFSRTHRVLEAIRAEEPDLIGFQEANDSMRAFLRKELGDYTVLGCGRHEQYNGEGIPVAYKTDKFELIGFETKWLSDTPNLPGSRFEESDQSKYPRIYHCVTLRCLENNQVIAFVNTHTDHTGKEAQVLEAKQLVSVMRSVRANGVILTGDMNAQPDSETVAVLMGDAELGLKDATAGIAGTFHNFGRRLPMLKIDYVFSTLESLECYCVEDTPVDGVYISDHQPTLAILRMEDEK